MFESRQITIDDEPTVFLWPKSDKYCMPIIMNDWALYADMIYSYTRKAGVVLQAGGNCGLYPYLYSIKFEKVFTLEPDSANFYCLALNCKLDKIIKMNMAVSNVCGFLEMQQLTNENVGMHKIGSGGNMVYGITIDALHLPELDLLHLDLEGYEENAMVGAIDTLLRCRPTVVLEMPDDPQNIYRMLKEVRYVSVKKYGESSLNEIFIPEEILPLLKIPLDKEPPKKSTRRKKTAPKKTS